MTTRQETTLLHSPKWPTSLRERTEEPPSSRKSTSADRSRFHRSLLNLSICSTSYTIYEGIRKLPPGHFAIYHNDRLVTEDYWKIDWQAERTISVEDAIDKVRSLFEDSIRLRLRSDVPLGAFLSGGIDSSLVAAVAQKQLGHPLKTFSIGFAEKDFDETHFAQMVATKIGSDHQRLEVTPDALQIMDALVYHFDEPFGDSSAIPTWYLSEWTKQHVTVALSGDGGDELFAGYDRYRALSLSQTMQKWLPISTEMKWLGKLPGAGQQRSIWRRLQRYCEVLGQPADKRYMNWIQIFGEQARIDLYREISSNSYPTATRSIFSDKLGERQAIAIY